MIDALKPLLESELLTDENKKQITEAWTKQLNEAKEEIETKLREEFTNRYEFDKGNLLEAVEMMVTDGIKSEIAEFVQDRKGLTEQRVKLANEIREARIESKNKLAAQMKVFETFMLEQLKNELSEFQTDRNDLREAKKDLVKQLRESRVAAKQELDKRVKTMESFVLQTLKEEIGEFAQDKKALVEQRVKMVKEGRAKIEQTRKEIIQRSAKVFEGAVSDMLRTELTQLREDINASRQKHFGSKLFEAFASEFEATFFEKNKIVKGLKSQIAESEKKLADAKVLFEQATKIATESQKKQQLAESRALRSGIMNELLSKLSGKQRDVMAELLEGVKTENLRESFKKYIPAVTNGTGSTILNRRTNQNLNENKTVVTGNKTNKVLEEAIQENDATNAEIIELKRLSGI